MSRARDIADLGSNPPVATSLNSELVDFGQVVSVDPEMLYPVTLVSPYHVADSSMEFGIYFYNQGNTDDWSNILRFELEEYFGFRGFKEGPLTMHFYGGGEVYSVECDADSALVFGSNYFNFYTPNSLVFNQPSSGWQTFFETYGINIIKDSSIVTLTNPNSLDVGSAPRINIGGTEVECLGSQTPNTVRLAGTPDLNSSLVNESVSAYMASQSISPLYGTGQTAELTLGVSGLWETRNVPLVGQVSAQKRMISSEVFSAPTNSISLYRVPLSRKFVTDRMLITAHMDFSQFALSGASLSDLDTEIQMVAAPTGADVETNDLIVQSRTFFSSNVVRSQQIDENIFVVSDLTDANFDLVFILDVMSSQGANIDVSDISVIEIGNPL